MWKLVRSTVGVFCLLVARSLFAQGIPEAPDPGSRPNTQTSAPAQEHPLVPAIALVRDRCVTSLSKVQDYEATFTKRELIQGKLLTQVMFIRLREQPFSVYLRYGGDQEGREILYVDGQNNNQLLAHEGSGFLAAFGTVPLDPKGDQAMSENHYPVTHIGMRNLVNQILDQWEIETKYGEIDVKYFPNAKLGDKDCEVIESFHPRPRKEFRFHVTRVFVEKSTGFPIRIENYGFPAAANAAPPLSEEYTYSGVKVNNGLTDKHFDRRNPDYKF